MSSTTPAQPLTLDPATFKTMLHGVVDALPHHPQAKPEEIAALREAAYLAISALRPRDPLEAMLAARIISAHFHAMHSLACAVQPNLPPALQLRHQGRAVALSLLTDASLRNLLNRQTAPARQPQGLPAAVGPDPRPQPAPQAARADTHPAPEATHAAPPPALPQAAAPQPPAPAQPTPAARPAANTGTRVPQPLTATPPQPAKTRHAPLDKTVADQLLAEAASRAHTVVSAIAA